VERLFFEDFFKWDAVSDKYFKPNLAGKISKIRIATFKKGKQTIAVKFSMNKEAPSIDIEVNSKTKTPLFQCYLRRLPISNAKFVDLSKLCENKVIPKPFHNEFIELPHSSNEKDALPDTDVEDNIQ
jgi:hypothetical protein